LQQQAFQAQQLGQYRLKRRIGSGGMGEVFEAEHILLRRRCAIKLIRPEQTEDPAVLERFEREVQAMAGLNHPNNVEVFDFGRAEDGTFYYVMEYLEGLTLEQLISRSGPLSPGRAIHLLRQVCRALREAHGIGLLHRDIKPSNIIVCTLGGEWDVVKLLDFGLVQSIGSENDSRLTLKGMILGSPPFMSPEQAAGRTDLTPATDIYSVGGVGYFLLTGHPPFVRETPMELLLAHAYEEVPPLTNYIPGLTEDLQQVILRCLAKKPTERYAHISELEAALLRCSDAYTWTEANAENWWKDLRNQPDAIAANTASGAVYPTIVLR
jgi:serine/threonine-protein kinase